jgi:hypothetical protein
MAHVAMICFGFLTRHCGYGQNECGSRYTPSGLLKLLWARANGVTAAKQPQSVLEKSRCLRGKSAARVPDNNCEQQILNQSFGPTDLFLQRMPM